MTTYEHKPESWDPRTEDDKLRALAQITAGMLHGRPAFEQRLGERGRGFPGKGSGDGARGSGALTPTEAAAEQALAGQRDEAEREQTEWQRDITRSLEYAARAWERYLRGTGPLNGVEKMADPGCELCASVPDHWCPVYGVRVIMSEAKNKRARPEVRTLKLCEWCFTRTWDSRMGRLPTHDEVTAHAEGRRVFWHGGVEPKLVEVACPECGDENREARRACTTCVRSGKVLKAVS